MRSRRVAAAVLLALGGALLLVVPALAAGVFPDVPSSHPYVTAIEDLAARNIISGYDGGDFGPENPVLRQQFAKMIVGTMDLPVSEADICEFDDVTKGGPDTLYPDNFVAVCAANGITQGKTPTTFAPYDNITRLLVITMIVRAADNLLPGTLQTPPTGWSGALNYSDPTHGANLRKADYNGLLAGLQGLSPTWDGYASSSRGECAQLLYNLLQLQGGGTTTSTTAPGPAYTTVDVETAYGQLTANEDAQLVDVREPAEWESTGVIEGAILIPLGQLEQRAPAELAKDKPVYVICMSGGRSRTGSETLVGLGFTDVYNIDGGMQAWISAGLPVETYTP